MRGQLRKLDRIVADFRSRANRVTAEIRNLPGIHLRTSHDPQGSVPSWVYLRTGGREQRDRFIAALQAENISASPMEGSAILPIAPYIEQKLAPASVAGWPSFATPHGRALKFGAACCPRTIEMRDRYIGVPMDPTYSDQDVADIIAAIRKVYAAVMQA
jgi:8-amino-3,8-dideoxy-alpha-D-manno-octulosonate transaminase